MKILMFLSNAFNPDPRVYSIAKSLVESNYSVELICWDRDGSCPSKETIDGINVERIFIKSKHGRGSSQIIFLYLFWIKALLKSVKKHIDIIYCHDFDTLPLGFILAKLKRKKLIYDSHESYVDMLADNVHDFIKKTIYKLENYLLKRVDLVITVGNKLKKSLENRGAKRVIVVGNWKNIEDFTFSKDVINKEKQKLGLDKAKLIITFIANLNPERQLYPLLEVLKNYPDIFLILGGKGPLESLAKEYAQKYKNIIYLGFVHPKMIPFYTCLADVIYYGFDPNNKNAQYSAPNKLFEALAAGKAIISGNFGEIAEIIKKFQCGVVIDKYSPQTIKNALMLLSKDDILKRMQSNAYRAAFEKFNWSRAKKILLDEIKNV